MSFLSWHGRVDLKREVIDALRLRREIGTLGPVELAGRPIEVFGWPGSPNIPALRDALGIPAGVLSVGSYLFHGFPEDEDATRDLIDEKIQLFEAIPVGHVLDDVARDFVVWRLADAEVGILAATADPGVRSHLEDVALALSCGEVADPAPIERALAEWSAEIPRQWQRDRHVDPAVYHNVHALTAALLANELPDEPTVASKFAESSMQCHAAPIADFDGMRKKLLALLAAFGPPAITSE